MCYTLACGAEVDSASPPDVLDGVCRDRWNSERTAFLSTGVGTAGMAARDEAEEGENDEDNADDEDSSVVDSDAECAAKLDGTGDDCTWANGCAKAVLELISTSPLIMEKITSPCWLMLIELQTGTNTGTCVGINDSSSLSTIKPLFKKWHFVIKELTSSPSIDLRLEILQSTPTCVVATPN